MSNKLDINKLLQKSSLTPIDYSGIEIPDITKVQQVAQNFKDWRTSQGFKTNEEKLQEAQERASAAWAELGNSEDVYDWYNAHQPDPRKQAKFREDGAKTAGLLMTVPLTVVSAGTMGWIPALTSTATGFAGAYGGQKLGEAIDTKYGTNTTPWLTLAGGLTGGIGGYRGLVKAGSAGLLKGSGQMYGKQFIGDVMNDSMKSAINKTNLVSKEPLLNVGWAPKQTIGVKRAGEFSEMYYPQRWDAVEEGANPFGIWLQGKAGVPRTDLTNPGKGIKAARARKIFDDRQTYFGDVTLNKPIQTIGEVPDRSALSYLAEKIDADGIIYNNVYDNGYNNNQVIFSFQPFKAKKPWVGAGNSSANPDLADAIAIRNFAQQHGYKVPKGIERYSGEMLDSYYKKILKQHNTFGRGVTPTETVNAETQLVYPYSQSMYHGETMPVAQNGVYTLASTSPYGKVSGVIQRHLDFSGPRNTWIQKNTVKPRYYRDVDSAITRKLSSDPVYQSLMLNGDFDGMWKHIESNYPKLFDSRNRIFTQTYQPNNGTFILGGVDGQSVGTVRRMFTPYSSTPKLSTKGFSKMKAVPDNFKDEIEMLDNGMLTGFKKGGKINPQR